MKFYHGASKIVKPKLEALAIAEGKLDVAMRALREAEDRLSACNARLKELKDAFDTQMATKQRIEDGANALQVRRLAAPLACVGVWLIGKDVSATSPGRRAA